MHSFPCVVSSFKMFGKVMLGLGMAVGALGGGGVGGVEISGSAGKYSDVL
jgi:ABC-type methionine transport system permease subunit